MMPSNADGEDRCGASGVTVFWLVSTFGQGPAARVGQFMGEREDMANRRLPRLLAIGAAVVTVNGVRWPQRRPCRRCISWRRPAQ
jgi:hypothetical protein